LIIILLNLTTVYFYRVLFKLHYINAFQRINLDEFDN
jgi:hypothetical protein